MSQKNRAAVLIGVQNAPSLPELKAVWDGVELMKDWAGEQLFQHVEVIWDKEQGSVVTGDQIFTAVNELCKPEKNIDQLVIYFSGHGMLSNRSELWLLSQAPGNPNEAISLRGSIELAQYGNVDHVVFISDACRTTPGSVGMGNINGRTIFPNFNAGGEAKEVDVFYATAPGEPALEIADSSRSYSGVYTDVFVEALKGAHAEIIDSDVEPKVIWPRKLKPFLRQELPKRVYKMTRKDPRNQIPDAIIQSDEKWISIFDGTQPVQISGAQKSEAVESYAAEAVRITKEMDGFFMHVIADPDSHIDPQILRRDGSLESTPNRTADLDFLAEKLTRIADTTELLATPFGPVDFETKCGFKSRGNDIVEAVGFEAAYELHTSQIVACHLPPNLQAVSTLLIFEDGFSALLPALRDFVCALTFDERILVHVGYEPAQNTNRWHEYEYEKEKLTNLRRAAAAASRMGRFHLDGEDSRKLARQMQRFKSLDPSLAVYAAHAYQDQERLQRLEMMHQFMTDGLGTCLFDVALLARKLIRSRVGDMEQIHPQLPLLSQAWPLLPVYEIQLPPELEGIERHIHTDSLWTLYDPIGTEKLRNVIEMGILQ